MGIGWNCDVSAVKVLPLQRLFDAGIDMLDTPSRRELPSLATIGIDNRSKQEIGNVLNCLSVSVSDRASSDKANSLSRRTSYTSRRIVSHPITEC